MDRTFCALAIASQGTVNLFPRRFTLVAPVRIDIPTLPVATAIIPSAYRVVKVISLFRGSGVCSEGLLTDTLGYVITSDTLDVMR